MGYYANCHGTVTIDTDTVDALWSAFCAAEGTVDVAAAEYADHVNGVAGKIASVIADAIGSECCGDGHTVIDYGDRFDLYVWATGKIRTDYTGAVLALVAEHGGTGCIEAVGEDDSRWRWRLAGGAVHDDGARTVYSGEVDTEGWIAQLQAPDSHGLDHVAVVPSEVAARAQIAAWCRDAYRAYRDEVSATGSRIDEDTDDDTVIERWTAVVGGVQYRVIRVGESADPASATGE